METSFHNPVALSLLPPGTWKQELLQIFESNPQTLFIYSKSALNAVDGDGEFLTQLSNNENVKLLTGIESNPSINQLASIRQELDNLPEIIIAMGGGSVIDIAKILISLDGFEYDTSASQLLDIIIGKEYLGGKVINKKLIALPTTAGTGSELTRWATIWDTENKKKFSVERKDLYPTTALVDPSLTVGMPKSITVSTGLDALTHAVEAYWSTKSNPIVRRLSAQAISQITHNLRVAIDSPEYIEARRGMCLGSIFAGLAFSQTRTTACHALSYPLTVRFGIPHGIAVAMSLMPIMHLNWDAIEEKELFLSAFGATSIEGIDQIIKDMIKGVVSLKISDYGVSRNEYIKMFKNKDLNSERVGNNPIPIDLETLDLYS